MLSRDGIENICSLACQQKRIAIKVIISCYPVDYPVWPFETPLVSYVVAVTVGTVSLRDCEMICITSTMIVVYVCVRKTRKCDWIIPANSSHVFRILFSVCLRNHVMLGIGILLVHTIRSLLSELLVLLRWKKCVFLWGNDMLRFRHDQKLEQI